MTPPTSRQAQRVFASFRDPSGFLFHHNGVLYRQVNQSYQKQYQMARDSGLLELTFKKGWMVPFVETQEVEPVTPDGFKIIKPELIPFISYPYEWCFSQIKDAALLTLDIHLAAIEHDMLLKDSSIYNVQFHKGRPLFIDHLSFDFIGNHGVWPAYGQFCRHFLAPLFLMANCDHRIALMYRNFIDGIPLDLASKMLPRKTWFNLRALVHLHLHAKSQMRYRDKAIRIKKSQATPQVLRSIALSLRKAVERLFWRDDNTEWAQYYNDTNYSNLAMLAKKEAVRELLRQADVHTVWDLGGNNGEMSRIASGMGLEVVCFDVDPTAVEQNYLRCVRDGETNILPLVMDLINPSPGLGFAGQERNSLESRGPADLAMALALIHHLAISNNLPFDYIAQYFASLSNWLIIEFVPKEDSQVERLLRTREDIFYDYNQDVFEQCFGRYFEIKRRIDISDSKRSIYLMVLRR